MIVTVTQNIPQQPEVITAGFRMTPTVTTPLLLSGEVNMIGVPGPPGPPGPSGTIIHVGPTAPPSPSVNDLWVDTS